MRTEDPNRPLEQERDSLERRANSTPGRYDPANYDPAQVQTDAERTRREWELAAREISSRLMDQPEDPDNVGLCLYVADVGPGDQVATFHWFESRDDLFEWVRTALPLNARRLVEGDPDALRKAVGAAVDRYLQQRAEAADTLIRLNDLLDPYCSLEWWGSLRELMTGPGEFARTLRLWYRETREDEEQIEAGWGDAPIALDEQEILIEALRHYR